jgi:hypothetical protein
LIRSPALLSEKRKIRLAEVSDAYN